MPNEYSYICHMCGCPDTVLAVLKECVTDLAEMESPEKGYFVSAEKARAIIKMLEDQLA